jgi:hypothetical protein
VVTDAVPTLEEDEVFGPRRRTNLREGALTGAAVEEEAVVARDGTEVVSNPPLEEEGVTVLDEAGPKRDPLLAEEDVADPKRLLGSGV